MKKTNLILFLIGAFIIGFSSPVFAQKEENNLQKKEITKEEQKAKRAEFQKKLTEAQINEINKRLNLDRATADKFANLYQAYVDDMNSFRVSSRKEMPKKSKDISNDDADKLIRKRFENSKKATEIKEKHYAQFKTVLTSNQILTVYEVENEMHRKLEKEHNERHKKREIESKNQQKQKGEK